MNNENKKSKNSAILGLFASRTDKLSKKQSNGFCNGVLTFCNGIEIDRPTEKHGKYLIAPFGDFKKGDYIQRVDSTAGEILKNNLGTIWSRIKNVFGNACPVYYEHPDNEDDYVIPDTPDKTPYGKVLSLENGDDGIYANIEWLNGFEMLPQRLQISPRWNAFDIADKVARPNRLISVGLTRTPNIKQTAFVNSETQTKETIIMDMEILRLLGYSEEAAQKIINKAADAPTDVLERIKTALTKKTEIANNLEVAQKDGSEKDKQLETAKVALANSQAALKKSQTARAKLVVANAIKDGKLAEFQRNSAEMILANSADFDKDEAALNAADKVVKTEPKTDGITAAENKQNELRQKFDEYVKTKTAEYGGGQEAYNRAWKEANEKYKGAFGETK